jgi:hypothetical protein
MAADKFVPFAVNSVTPWPLWGFNSSHLICIAPRVWHHGGVLVVGQPWWKANGELAKINNVRAKPLAPVTMPAQSQGTEGCKEGPDTKPDYQIKYPTPIPLTVPEGRG